MIDVDALRAKVTISPAEVERSYNENIEQYSTPEQVRASHILLKTEGKEDAVVKARAEDVLRQAKSGADFAALAKKFSEDESNAGNGGDLTTAAAGWSPSSIRRRSRWSRGRSATWSRRSTAIT